MLSRLKKKKRNLLDFVADSEKKIKKDLFVIQYIMCRIQKKKKIYWQM